MNKFFTIVLVILFQSGLQAQTIVSLDYDWGQTPSFEITDADTAETVLLKKHLIREFYVDSEGMTEYAVDHSVMLLNSDRAIEENNKVFFPSDQSSEILTTKARVISPEGKIKELSQSDILTAEDEETGDSYQYFAFEGIKTGSIIEYYYTRKMYPSYQGTRVFMQSSYPSKDITFDLYAPDFLIFEYQSYNGLKDVELDTLYEEKDVRHWSIHEDYISEIPLEDLSDISAHRKSLIYKLDRNLSNGLNEISSYGGFSENIYRFMYTDLTKADKKDVAKYVKKIEIDESWSEEKKIRTLEDYLKENIHVIDSYDPELNKIDLILKNNFTTSKGFTRLFANCLKELNINMQVVLTTDRSELPFDSKFEAATFLREYLFYFPKSKKFTAPDNLVSRLGYPPFEYTDNYGLFIKEVSLGDFETGIGKIKYITATPYKDNFDKLEVNVHFDSEDLLNLDLHIDHMVGGYYAMYVQPILGLVEEKDADEITDGQINFINEDFEIKNKEVVNGDVASFGIVPFQVKADVHSDALVEKAGDKYLFKIGELIGPQMEMYQEKKRQLPVSTGYGHHYERRINFTVPDGYKVEGLEKLTMDNQESVDEDGEVDFYFVSSYEQKDNSVTVVIEEYYTKNMILPKDYEKYRSVINSAADFNKITLVLVQN
ncbi:MAG: hypothetical protein ACI837_000592 [Crocinitomicaceae bacterium]|jgi:hypothetical protein